MIDKLGEFIKKKIDRKITISKKNKTQIIKEFGQQDATVYLNMDLLGLDLSSVPSSNLRDFKTLIIPFLYVVSSVISMKLTMNMQATNQKAKDKEKDEQKEETEMDMLQSTNRSMSYMMPIMAFSISLVAPLGLALYWLMSNILMIIERLLLNKIISSKKEEA